MKKVFILLLVCCFLLSSCENVKWVKIDEEGTTTPKVSDEEIEEEAKGLVESILESIGGSKDDEEEDDEPIKEIQEDRVDVKLDLDSAEVSGTINGFSSSFSTPYDDKEAIIFDIAKEWGLKVKEIRHLVYFNGMPYSTKAITQQNEEAVQELEKDIENFNPETIPYMEEFDEGIVRGIGCDLERGLLKLKLFNEFNEDLPMFRNVIPRIKGALVVYLNNKVIELHCVDSIAPYEEIECIKANLKFSANKEGSAVDPDAEFDLVDILAIFRPGMNKQFVFTCEAKE